MSDSAELWNLLAIRRDSGAAFDLPWVIAEARKRGIRADISDVRDLAWRHGAGAMGLVPHSRLVEVFIDISMARRPRSVLDPFAGVGFLVIPVVERASPQTAAAISFNRTEAEIGALLSDNLAIQWILANVALDELSQTGEADLVISCPPWGGRVRSTNVNGTQIGDDLGHLIVAKACGEHLSSTGLAAVVLPPSFLSKNSPGSLRSSLSDLGLHLSGVLHIPSGFFAATAIESYLVLIDREAHSDLFVGELSTSAEHNKVLLHNFFARRSGSQLALGSITTQEFSGYRSHDVDQRVAKLVKSMGLKSTPLVDIAFEINLTKSRDPQDFADRDNAVYLPLIGTSPVRTSREELSLKAHNYAQIVLDSQKALAPYVAGYFNSTLGRTSLEGLRSGTTIRHVTKAALSGSSIYLADLNAQLKCIQADSRASNLMSELSALRKQIWDAPLKISRTSDEIERVNHENSLLSWMEALPFPLGSILWTYNSVTPNKERYEHLLHFFEAVAQFYALVMWSATYSTPILRSDERYPLRPDKPFQNSLERSTFGTWIEMASRLAKFGRTLLNAGQDGRDALTAGFGTADADLLRSLFASEIIDQLQTANSIRNRTVGHGGIVSAQEAGNRRVLLENVLATVRDAIGSTWRSFPLLKAGAVRIKSGAFHYDAERIMGRSAPFERIEATTKNAIEDGRLFLFAQDTNVGVPLIPLIFVGPPPQGVQNACYFYNRIDNDGVRFVSYHFEEQAEVHRVDPDIDEALHNLVESTGT